MDWDLISTPQAGAQNRRIHYAQGKTLSGSSALNAMAYHRGNIGGYQWWANLTSDRSYTFQNLLPYFRKSCNFTAPNYTKRQTPNATVKFDSSAFSAAGGPLQVSYSNWVDPALTWLQRAFASIGLPVSDAGFNSGSLLGRTAWIPSTINPLTGERSSSQASFLEQAIANTNIIVYTQSQATKILFNSAVANSVSVTTKGVPYTISANKEVILSAGVFHSPQLLMLSGKAIGNYISQRLPYDLRHWPASDSGEVRYSRGLGPCGCRSKLMGPTAVQRFQTSRPPQPGTICNPTAKHCQSHLRISRKCFWAIQLV